MPSHTRAIQIKLPEAEVLADLYGVEYDLDTSVQLCLKARDLSKETPVDYLLVEAVVTAALIRFFRCIGTGVRLGVLISDIETLNEEDHETYEYLKNLRNKHVAHSVNPFENSYVTASATVKDGKMLPIKSLNPGNHRVLLSASTAQVLLGVVRKVRDINQAKIVAERERVLAVVQAQPLEEIHAGDLYTPEPLRNSHVSKSRRTKTRSNKSLRPTSALPRQRG